MSGLIPLVLAVVIAEAATQLTAPLAPLAGWRERLIVIGLVLTAWLLTSEIAARLIARTGRRVWLGRWEWTAQTLILAGYAWICLGWGWSAAPPRLFTLALAPWIALQVIHWWTSTVAVRAITGRTWTRTGRAFYQMRFGVLPMLLILPFFDVGAWIAQRWNLESTWFAGSWGLLLAALCAQLFIGVVLILQPLVLLPLWGVKPLAASEPIGRLMDGCRRAGVSVAGLMYWPESTGSIYNAMVVGVAPRLRYVLLSRDLLRDLPPEQVDAVLGHELGHVRHHHLRIYFFCMSFAAVVAKVCEPLLIGAMLPLAIPAVAFVGIVVHESVIESVVRMIIMLAVTVVVWRVGFGVLSRACERQADLVGAELVGDPRVMGAALRSVARLSGDREDTPNWCHYSIAQRVAFLESAAERPGVAACHHRLVRTMWRALAVFFVVLLLLALWLSVPGQAPHPVTMTHPLNLDHMIFDLQRSAA